MLCEESETFEDDWNKRHKIKVIIFNNCVKLISNYESFPVAYLSPEEAIRLGRFLTSKICTSGGGEPMRIYDHVDIDKEQVARYLALRKKDASITWDDIINKGLEEWDKLVQMDEEADRKEKELRP